MRKSKFVFVGVSTAGSSIMKIFPQWSTLLGLDAEIVGCDLPLRSAKKTYRRVLREIRDDPKVVGALVTAHKIDLLRAGRDLIGSGEFQGFMNCIGKVLYFGYC